MKLRCKEMKYPVQSHTPLGTAKVDVNPGSCCSQADVSSAPLCVMVQTLQRHTSHGQTMSIFKSG